MYFPYLRNKQEEMFALRELSSTIVENEVLPILEPVRTNLTHFARLIDKNVPFILIINPQVPTRNRLSMDIIRNNLYNKFNDYENLTIGYIIQNGTEREILEIGQRYNRNRLAFIHSNVFSNGNIINTAINTLDNVDYNIFRTDALSLSYLRTFTNVPKVSLEDGFRKMERNTLYPAESIFSSNHLSYTQSGFAGVGDFLTIGAGYQESGSVPNEVVIHLSYNDSATNEVLVKHFKSDLGGGQANVQGKFLQANSFLIEALDNQLSHIDTAGAQDFRQQNTFPGLGKIKRFSMKHHIELMSSLI